MSIDQNLVSALSNTLEALNSEPDHPIPTNVIATLSTIAKPGTRLAIDLEASQTLGAPLVVVFEGAKDTLFLSALTKRQKQVAELVIIGKSNRQISEQLEISLHTVKDHVHAILQRLELPSRTAMIAASRA